MTIPFNRNIVFLISLCGLILIGYSSGLNSHWHLDDIPTIVRNEKIKIEQFDLESLTDTFFAGATGRLYRPVPMLSFALNWYYGRDDVVGYHIVNILIHCINGYLLYLVVSNLMLTPRLSGVYTVSEIRWMAVSAALFWALNPIQTQAVTYIVQRMAAMSALFYLLGLYLFLRYKKSISRLSKIALVGTIVGVYGMAILSKENAVLFPLGLLLIDAIFFSIPKPQPDTKRKACFAVTLILVSLVIGVIFFFLERENPLQFIENLYANRPFSLLQRLLTEPRVLLLYLSLIYFPIPSRFSICHDIAISTSWFEPLTTIPAILIVTVLIVLSILFHKKKPLITFACLFFFLNHCVESTILPLELVFEHRNYLPSIFLFLPFSHLIIRLKRGALGTKKYGRHLLLGASCIIIALLCSWVFERNLAWRTERSLWEDEMAKNPQLARPCHNLAWGYYQARGDYEKALVLYKQALRLKSHSALEIASTLNNMGRIYYLTGRFEQALHFFRQSMPMHPQPRIAEYQVVMALIQLCRWSEALKLIDANLQLNHQDAFFLKLKGIVLSRLGEVDEAIAYLTKSLEQKPTATDTRLHLSIALSRKGRYGEASGLLSEKALIDAESPQVLIVLSEIERMRNNGSQSDAYLERLIGHQGIEKTRKILIQWENDNLSFNVDYNNYITRIDQSRHWPADGESKPSID